MGNVADKIVLICIPAGYLQEREPEQNSRINQKRTAWIGEPAINDVIVRMNAKAKKKSRRGH